MNYNIKVLYTDLIELNTNIYNDLNNLEENNNLILIFNINNISNKLIKQNIKYVKLHSIDNEKNINFIKFYINSIFNIKFDNIQINNIC